MKYYQRLLICFTLIALVPISNVHSAKKVSICSNDSIQQLDPHETNDEASMEGIYLKIYEPLVKRSANKKVIIPLLVKDWHNNGLEWKFKLRENVMFHSNKYFKPTRPMNTQDIKFSFERLLASTSNISLNLKKWIDEIKIVDQQTIVFKLKKQGDFLEVLLLSAGIMSKEYYEQLEEKDKLHLFTARPIGTGPFSFKSFKKGSYFKLQSFKKYHLGKVLFDELEFLKVYNNKLIDMLTFGVCDIALEPTSKHLDAIEKNTNFKIESSQHFHQLNLLLSLEDPLLKSSSTRNAIASALEPKRYIQSAFYGAAANIKTNRPFIAKSEESVSSKDKIDLNKNFSLLIAMHTKLPKLFKTIEFIRDDITKAGMKVNVFKTSEKNFKHKIEKGTFQLALDIDSVEHLQNQKIEIIPLLSFGKLIITNKNIKNFYYAHGTIHDYSTLSLTSTN